MSEPQWIGAQARVPQEDPESPQTVRGGSNPGRRVTLRGPYEFLADQQPDEGAVWDGTWRVRSSTLRHGRGGVGVLAIDLVRATPDPSAPLSDAREINWQRIEKPLLAHSRYSAVSPESIELWRNEPDVDLRRDFKYQTDAGVVQLEGDLLAVAQKILRGVESYIVFTPVVSRRREYATEVATGGCGRRETPTGFSSLPAGYEWLKTSDALVEQANRNWIRHEEWTGADEWDHDLYEAAT